jgi:hypothetical protein
MLCADRVPIKNTHFQKSASTQTGSPDPRNDRICITSSCPRQLVVPICLLASVTPPSTALAPYISRRGHDGPGHPCNLVGQRDRSNHCRSALHNLRRCISPPVRRATLNLKASTLRSQCPLWVISRHVERKRACPLYPPKADMCSATRHVCFVPIGTFWQVSAMSALISKADICSRPSNIRLSAVPITYWVTRLRSCFGC